MGVPSRPCPVLLGDTGAKPALVHTPLAPGGLLRMFPWGFLDSAHKQTWTTHSKIPNGHLFFSFFPILPLPRGVSADQAFLKPLPERRAALRCVSLRALL